MNIQARRNAMIITRPQARAAKDGPSFGIRTSGGASGAPTCLAPQEAHSVELISRLRPQQGHIIEPRRGLLFICKNMKSGATDNLIFHMRHEDMKYEIWNRLNRVVAQAQIFSLLFLL